MTRKNCVFGAEARGSRRERVLSSARFVDGQFRNTTRVAPGLKGNPLPILGEYFFSKNERVPPAALPMLDPRALWQRRAETGLRATWLGHSTVLLEMDGIRVLTDPVFGERASPLSFAGPKRFHQPPVSIAQLPKLDAILVSHDHYDHLCRYSIGELVKLGVPFITSLGVGAHLEAWGVPPESIVELDWWESHTMLGGTLRFTAAPSQHFSGRRLGDRNHTLWSSWRIQTDRRSVYFSGDTGLHDELTVIGQKLGPFDLVMLEIGAFHPSWGEIHLGPDNARKGHQMLGSGVLLPVHWGTFNLAMHPWDEPAESLHVATEKTSTRVLTPKLGDPVEPDRLERSLPWWREVHP
jgi:L-ascorbate metabolism protein UlaG (beta-lactamase superfamily)